jgi:hypothetical protein
MGLVINRLKLNIFFAPFFQNTELYGQQPQYSSKNNSEINFKKIKSRRFSTLFIKNPDKISEINR